MLINTKPNLCIDNTLLFGEENSIIENLHIFAHGSEYGLQLAGNLINEEFLLENADILKSWQIQNLYLWSCQIGKNQKLINLLAQLTGANVFSVNIIFLEKILLFLIIMVIKWILIRMLIH